MAPLETGSDIRLTTLTNCGGCAAKLGADLLQGVLAQVAAVSERPPKLLVGLTPPDDAAVYELSPELAVVATLDFFPPVVDDPFTYGQIAAANAVSDIFAMGGRTLFALNIAALPESMPSSVVEAIFAGGMTVVREAGGVIAGGHTIRDEEPKYGLAVVGLVDPRAVMLRSHAVQGDLLMLTKPLGTGLIVSGQRQGRVSKSELGAAVGSMRMLNRRAAEVLTASGIRAATDVTGFGLLGHALEMAMASRVRIVITADSLPALPGALKLAERGIRTDGSEHNRRFVEPMLERRAAIQRQREALAFDPQTSGGLLAAVSPARAGMVATGMESAGLAYWWVGRVEEGSGILLSGS